MTTPDAGDDRPAGPSAHGLSRRHVHALCLFVTLLVGLSGITAGRPMESHELFVAQTAMEMQARHDLITPFFNAEPRLVKPPLAYWLVIGVDALGPDPGFVHPWEARLPSLVSAMALVSITVELGWLCFGSVAGLVSGLFAATCMVLFTYGNTARPEMLYGATASFMLLAFAHAYNCADRSPSQLRWALLAWIGAGLACMAKGPHLPLIILGGMLVHMGMRNELRRALFVFRPHFGLPIWAILVAPWPILVNLRAPEAAAVWNEQLIGNSGAEKGKWLLSFISAYYLYATPQILLPWAIALPSGFVALWKRRQENRLAGLLLAVIITTLLVMTIPNHRRGYYLLPILAPLCVLVAMGAIDFLTDVARGVRGLSHVRMIVFGAAIASCAFAGGVASSARGDLGVVVGAAVAIVVCIAVAVLAIRRLATTDVDFVPAMALGAIALCWGAAMAGVGGAHSLWGERRYALAAFAADVAEAIGDGAALSVMDVEPAPFVYALQSHVERVRAREGFESVASPGSWFVAATDREQAIREAGLHVEAVLTNERADDHPGGLTLYRVAGGS